MRPRRRQSADRKHAAAQPGASQIALSQLVRIEKPIYGGAFLARIEGKAIFVPLALPGEEVRIRIVEDKRGFATAELEEIVAEAPERIAPVCRHFGTCGGCHYQQAGYETQLGFKKAILRETLERAGVRAPEEISLLCAADESQSWGYRNRIRLAFDAEGNVGYRGRRSRAVVSIEECPIAAPLLLRAARSFAEVARRLSPSLRTTEISLFCNSDETSLLASIFIAKPANERLAVEGFGELAHALAEQIRELKGAELIVEGRTGERTQEQIPRTVAQWGEPSLTYGAAGIAYRVDLGAFFQVNRRLIDGLVEKVTGGKTGGLAWDLFAGVGLFARKLTGGFERVVAVETAPSAVSALKENLHGTTGSAVRTPALDFLRRDNKSERPDFIVVDPPRTGLGAEIATLLAGIGAPALTYVSCDPATLARDLRALIASGYEIESLTLADLFPHTFHLETVVHLRRCC